MRIAYIAATIALLWATAVHADNCASHTPSLVTEASIRSGYLTPYGALISRNPVLQTSHTLSLCRGVYVNLWHSLDLRKGPNKGSGDELQVTVGWVGLVGSSGFTLDLGITHFNVPPLMQLGQEDLVSPYAELTAPEYTTDGHKLAPYARIEAYRDMGRGRSANFQPFGYIGVKHEWTIRNRWSISQRAYGARNPKALDLQTAYLAGYEGSVKYAISDRVTIHPLLVKATVPLTHPGDGRKPAATVGTGITIAF